MNYSSGDYALNNLNIEFDKFQRKARNLALSNPKKYGEVQEKVNDKMRNAAVKGLYELLYRFMYDGELKTGEAFDTIDKDVGVELGPVRLPESEIRQIAINISNMLDKEIVKIIDMVLPDPLSKLKDVSILTKQEQA